jgi:XTP/dITP diphosphohydrolase
MKKIIFASNNRGKIKELNALLSGVFEVVSMQDEGVSEVAEDALSFVENALIKARNASKKSGLPALADDSGLVVAALQGAPGIYSARYAGVHGDDEANLQKLLFDMKKKHNRQAKFWCAMVFITHEFDSTPIVVQASWTGEILDKKVGENGFGYDPIFYVPTHHCTAAELPTEIKNQISHRALALKALLTQNMKF